MPHGARVRTVYLIRHGETQANREGRFRGLDDVPLSQRGLAQADGVARSRPRW